MHVSLSLRRGLAALYLLTTLVLFFLPGSALPKAGWLDKIHVDKIVHVGLFAFMAVLICWAWMLGKTSEWKRLFFALVGYGLAVEIIQGLWISNRSFDLWDLLADSVGALVGLYGRSLWCRRRRSQESFVN